MGLTSTHPLVAGSRPIVVSHFVSRDEMARLKDALDPAGVVTVCALQGQRGTGKSQLAAKYADECAASTTVEWSFVLWVAAPNRTAAIDGLAEIAKTAGIVELDAEPEFAAKRLVARLNTTGPNGDDYRLLVFDNVENMSDLDGLLPGGPRTRVVVTTTQSVTTTGVPVEVGVYTAEQAVQFLVEVTGLPDPEGAALLAKDLGRLPVALTQAAEVINGRGHSTFAVYADALAGADELSSVMQHPEGDPYGLTVDKALRMGYQDAVDACTRKAPEQGQAALAVLQALSVLAESGVPRVWLSVLGEDGDVVQDVVSELVARHVVEKAADGSQVYLHGLKSRVIGEDSPGEDVVRAAIAVLAGVNVLNDTCDYMDKRAMIAALGAQLLAVHTQTGSSSLLDEPDLLAVASRAIYVANELQDPYTPISLSMFLADMERVLGSDHPSTLASRNNLAGAYESAGRLGEAISLFEAALVDRERVLGSDHPDTLASRNNLAYAYMSAGSLDQAISLFEAALVDRERVLGSDHPDTLASRNNLAGAYESAGSLGKAIPLFEATLTDCERVLGPDHPSTLRSRSNLAGAYQSAGRLDKAIRLYVATLADCERVLGSDHPDTLASRHNLAGAYESAGRLGKAISLYVATLAGRERVLGSDHPDTLASRNNLAYAYKSAGRLGKAISLYEATLADRERVLGSDHPSTLVSRHNLAGAYRSAGRLAEAIGLAEATLADCDRVLGPDHPLTVTIRSNLEQARKRL